nr:hypothetical protein [Butyrivibrio sp. WCE2006]
MIDKDIKKNADIDVSITIGRALNSIVIKQIIMSIDGEKAYCIKKKEVRLVTTFLMFLMSKG